MNVSKAPSTTNLKITTIKVSSSSPVVGFCTYGRIEFNTLLRKSPQGRRQTVHICPQTAERFALALMAMSFTCTHVMQRLLLLSGDVELNPGPLGQHSEDPTFTFKNIITELKAVVEWKSLGVQLDIIATKIKEIEVNNRYQVAECKHDMVQFWLESDTSCSWKSLIDALITCDHLVLAEEIRCTYCPLYEAVAVRERASATHRGTAQRGTTDPSSTTMSQPSNSAVCGCGQDAVLLTVRKDSVNKGHQFYSCARRKGGCDFFLWADQGDAISRVSSGPLQQAPVNNQSARTSDPSSTTMSHPANGAVCGCGQDAVLLTVRKEDSMNKGRQFYSCVRREGGCDFFLWANQGDAMSRVSSGPLQQAPVNNQSANASRKPGFLAPQNRGAKVSQGHSTAKRKGSVVCTCGDQAVQRTVQKDGPNKGRSFYRCPKPRDDQCDFFEWADDSQTSSNAGNKWGPPTCSVCREQGHTKRTCPQGQGT